MKSERLSGRRLEFPSLFDTSESHASLPLQLVTQWERMADHSPQAHERFLAPYKKWMTVVCSDSAGLSRMSKKHPLPLLLQHIDRSKRMIAAYANQIGGIPVGIQTADNMTYRFNKYISPEEVVMQMIAAQKEIFQLEVHVGIAIHTGFFYDFGGSLWGENFKAVETIAEEHTKGGEILVSEHTRNSFRDTFLRSILTPRNLEDFDVNMFSFKENYLKKVKTSRRKSRDDTYPAPFSPVFTKWVRDIELKTLKDSQEDPVLPEYLKESERNGTIAFFQIEQEKSLLLMDELSKRVKIHRLCEQMAKEFGIELIESDGSQAIFTGSNPTGMLEFSKSLREMLGSKPYGCSSAVGMTQGYFLHFLLSNGEKRLAGSPLNLAAKLAQDAGLSGIAVEDTLAEELNISDDAVQKTIKVSGVEIQIHLIKG